MIENIYYLIYCHLKVGHLYINTERLDMIDIMECFTKGGMENCPSICKREILCRFLKQRCYNALVLSEEDYKY